MRYLLRVDLQVIGNLFRHRENLKHVIVGLVMVLCVSCGIAVGCRNLFLPPVVLDLVRDDTSGTVLRFLICLVMMPTLLLAFTIALGQVGRDLFESPMASLLIASPVSRRSILAWTFSRITFSIIFYGSLIEAAPLCLVLWRATGTIWGALLFPVAAIFLVAPLVAAVILAHVVLMRWLAKPWTRMLLSLLGGLAGFAFFMLTASGVMTGKSSGEELASFMQTEPRLPLLLGVPTDVLLRLMGQPAGSVSILTVLIVLLSPVVLLACAAPIYERAFENASVTFRPTLTRTVRYLGRGWPTKPAASLFRRDLVQLVQQPTNLIGYLFLAGFVYMIARSDPLSISLPEGSKVPEIMGSVACVYFTWLLTALMLACMSVLDFAAECPYIVLYQSSPVRPASLLRGRMATLLLPFGWCFALALLFGRLTIGASFGSLLLFTGFALPTMFMALGLITGLATLAMPLYKSEGAPMVDVTRMIITMIGVACAMGITLGVGLGFWNVLSESYADQGTLAGTSPVTLLLATQAVAWVCALLVGGLGYALGQRNYRKLLTPEA